MRRREVMFVRQLLDFLRSQSRENLLRQVAQQRVAQPIDSFEMFKEKDQAFEVRRLEFAVDAVQRMRDRVRDRLALQVSLQLEDVVAQPGDLCVLRFRDSPDEKINLAGILRKMSRDLLAQKCVRQLRDPERSVDRVVIGDGYEVHALRAQDRIQLLWI